MRNEIWTKGMASLVAVLPPREKLSAGAQKIRGDVYRQKLEHLTDEQWMRTVDLTVEREAYFPTIATLLELSTEGNEDLMLAEGQQLLALVLSGAGSSYNAQSGRTWSLRGIVEATNSAFGEAVSSVGLNALANCDPHVGVPIRDRMILKTYAETVRRSPQLRLPAGEAKPELPSRTEAKDTLARLREEATR
jgi:hypothetical protein